MEAFALIHKSQAFDYILESQRWNERWRESMEIQKRYYVVGVMHDESLFLLHPVFLIMHTFLYYLPHPTFPLMLKLQHLPS